MLSRQVGVRPLSKRLFAEVGSIALLSLCTMYSSLPAAARDTVTAPGDRLFADGKFNQAHDAYAVALKHDPKNVALHIAQLRTLLRLDNERWRDAIAEGKAAVGYAPQNAELHGLYSLALMRGGRPDAAAVEAKKALDLNPNSYYGLVATGRVLIWNEKNEEALKPLRHAVELRPDQPDGYYYLIDAMDVKQRDEAMKLVKAYVKLKPMGHPHDRAIDGYENSLVSKNSIDKVAVRKIERDNADAEIKAADDGSARSIVFTTPIDRHGDDIIVPVTINGAKFRMLFDTGAGHGVTLTEEALSRLKLPALGQSISRGVSGKETSQLYHADNMTIGRQSFHNVVLESMGTQIHDLDGLFGGANFDDCAVTVDFEQNIMTMARGKNAAAPPPAEGNHVMTVPFHNIDGYIVVPIRLADRTEPEWAMLDTGAEGLGVLSLMTARDLAKKLVTGGEDDIVYKEVTVNRRLGVGDSAPSFTALLFRFAVDLALCNNSGAPFFMELQPLYGASMIDEQVSRSFDFHLSALVGISYLTSARRITIDYPHHLLTMELPGT
jgi:tetratricopeptide (TPR) repeat protein